MSRFNKIAGLALTAALSMSAGCGSIVCADDDSKDAAATTKAIVTPMPADTATSVQQTTSDPVAQAIAGTPVTQGGEAALQHYDLAKYYGGQWQFDMAEVELEVTIMYAPNMKIAHRDYSLISIVRGHPVRAFAEALMTVGICEAVPLNDKERKELEEKASKLHYRKGIAYAEKSKWGNAISELKWAQTYTPTKPAVTRSLAFCYASSGDFSLAEQQYNQCFAVDPDDAMSHADFASLLAEHGNTDRAEGQLEQALKLSPRAAALHVDMGWLAERKSDYPTAQNEFEQAIKLCPNQPGIWLQLGHVFERAGKFKEARDAYSRVLAIDPSEDEATKRLRSLKAAAEGGDKPVATPAKGPS